MSQPVLVDTGPLVALRHEDDASYERCLETLKTLPTPLLTCWPVLTEAAYLLRRHPEQMRQLLSAAEDGFLRILPLTEQDIPPIRAILAKYEDQHFQLADAALMWLAERENITEVFTLDHRDFCVYRSPSGKPLQIVPDPADPRPN